MATKASAARVRNELWQNPRGIPTIGTLIALSVKESALWRCTKCNQQCLRPGKKSGLTKSERCSLTLTVHHRNRIPEDNRPENLIALCTACHLSYHNRGQSNVSPGQLSLFPDDDIDWNIMDGSLESARGDLSDRNPPPLVWQARRRSCNRASIINLTELYSLPHETSN